MGKNIRLFYSDSETRKHVLRNLGYAMSRLFIHYSKVYKINLDYTFQENSYSIFSDIANDLNDKYFISTYAEKYKGTFEDEMEKIIRELHLENKELLEYKEKYIEIKEDMRNMKKRLKDAMSKVFKPEIDSV